MLKSSNPLYEEEFAWVDIPFRDDGVMGSQVELAGATRSHLGTPDEVTYELIGGVFANP